MKKHEFKEKLNREKSEFKHKKHLIRPIILISLLILLQIFLIIYLYNRFAGRIDELNLFWVVLRVIFVIHIINLEQPIDYKLAWIIPTAILPVFSILLYIVLEIAPGPKQLKRRLANIKVNNMEILTQDKSIMKEIKSHEKIDYGLDIYLKQIAGYPIYKNTKLDYFTQGEDYFHSLLKDIKEAKEFIYLEFFIVRRGVLMDQLLDLLEEKVHEGLEVKFMYDGMNGFYLPSDYKEYLESRGIETVVFYPVYPIISTYHNNRDHRKIVSIDNRIAYTGGLNLADEYINELDRFGHWKDNGIRLEGDAVLNFTVMFMNLWELAGGSDIDLTKHLSHEFNIESQAFVQPYDDAPNDGESIGENVYVDILNQAKEYVYIMTPYLILSEKIQSAIRFASKRGVDVRIMMPGIPDKIIPYNIGRSYYENLIKNGVKIYEYTPGFLHSKSFVSDDITSVVGTINLDFRSLHLHYENGVLVYDEEFAKILQKDFIETQKVCRQMTIQKYKELNFLYRFIGRIMRVFAPLM